MEGSNLLDDYSTTVQNLCSSVFLPHFWRFVKKNKEPICSFDLRNSSSHSNQKSVKFTKETKRSEITKITELYVLCLAMLIECGERNLYSMQCFYYKLVKNPNPSENTWKVTINFAHKRDTDVTGAVMRTARQSLIPKKFLITCRGRGVLNLKQKRI